VTVYDAEPGEAFTEQDNSDGTLTVTVIPYDCAENEQFSYLWTGTGNGGTGSSVTLEAGQVPGLAGTVFDSHGGGTCYYFAFNPWYPPGPPVMPTVSISEYDAGGIVFEGDVAHFDIHLSQAVSQNVTVFYNTVDPSSGPATDYVSTSGPKEVTIAAGQTDAIVSVNTVGGIYDGTNGSVEVQLSHPYLGQFLSGTAPNATATILHLGIAMTSPGTGTVSGTDANGNPLVTTVVVGQQMALQLTNLPAGFNGTVQWVIPGTGGNLPYAIENYTQSRSGGIVTAFGARDRLLQKTSVQYYWTQGTANLQTYAVTCDVALNPGATPVPVTAAFTVLTPALTLSARTTTLPNPIDVRPFNGPTKQLQFGTDNGAPTEHGITWTVRGLSVAGNATETGSVQIVDLLNSYNLRTMKNGTKTVAASNGRYLLDDYNPDPANLPPGAAINHVPVGGVVMSAGPSAADTSAANTLYDSPYVTLPPRGPIMNVAASDQFTAYLMYRPAGANSIWVTVQTMVWNWSGSAKYSWGWGLAPGATYLRQPAPVNSPTLPTWGNYWSLVNSNPVYSPANTISGTVTNAGGVALGGVTVAASWNNGNVLTATTSANGAYSITGAFGTGPVNLTGSGPNGVTCNPLTVDMAGNDVPNMDLEAN
jgi:hypothetical protein